MMPPEKDGAPPSGWLGLLAWHLARLAREPRAQWLMLARAGSAAAPGLEPLARLTPWLLVLLGGQALAALLQRPGAGLAGLLAALLATAAGLGLSLLLVQAWVPRFGGQRDRRRAAQLVLHAAWPALAAALLAALLAGLRPWPALALQLLGALWCLYLLRLGLPPLMRVPEPRAWPCTAAIAASALLLALLLMLARCGLPQPGAAGLAGAGSALPAASPASAMNGRGPSQRVAVEASRDAGTGLVQIDMEAAREAWERGMAAASAPRPSGAASLNAPAGGALAAAMAGPSRLAELLPERLCGLPRRSLQSRLIRQPAAADGRPQDYAEALAEYRDVPGGPVLRMTLADRTPAVGVMIGLHQLGLQEQRNTAHGWLRTREVDGVFMDERWDSRRREAGVRALIADRFLVNATLLQAETPDCAAEAVRAPDWRRLQAWAKEPSR